MDDSTSGRLSVQLLNPLHQDQGHIDQDEAEADYESKLISKRRRLQIKHRVEVPTYDLIRGEINATSRCKADDGTDGDPLIFWKKAQQMDRLKQLAAVSPAVHHRSTLNACFEVSIMSLILNGKRSRLNYSARNLLNLMHCPSFMITSFSFSL